jgi:hypothetical protein
LFIDQVRQFRGRRESNGGRALTQQQAAALLLSPSLAHDMPT